jgi:CHAT domain-containing protein
MEYGGGLQSRRALPEAEEEGRSLAAIDTSAVLLVNSRATKPRLRELWENAPYVYIAAHAGADELPYLSAVSLAAPQDDQTPDADVLDVTDIRAADLRRCDLVVLSGCSSGLQYIAAMGAAPSLGDAFLDAGAGAVIHTFWDITDDDARRIGAAFTEEWKSAKKNEIRAIADARRARVRGPKGVRHPFFWASYAITVSRL